MSVGERPESPGSSESPGSPGSPGEPPRAPQVPHTWQRPTGPVEDPWAWLADRDDPATVAYLEAENQYADAWFSHADHAALVQTLFDEIKSRVQEDDTSVPVRHGDWWYVSRTQTGASYAIHGRAPVRHGLADHGLALAVVEHTTILDENVEAANAGGDGGTGDNATSDSDDDAPATYFALGTFDVSPDHTLLAWSRDTDGSEHYTLRIRDLSTGSDLADELHDTTWAGTAWSANGEHLFYVTADDQERPFRVWRHRVGTAQADDVLVLEEPDERFLVSVGLTRSQAWIVIETESKTSSEAHVIPADDAMSPPRLIRARRPDVEYHVDHWRRARATLTTPGDTPDDTPGDIPGDMPGDDLFVILTNSGDGHSDGDSDSDSDGDGDGDRAPDFRVVIAPVDDPASWRELIPHRPGCRITRVEPFATHLVLHEWERAQPRLRIVGADGRHQAIDLGDEPHDVDLDSNPDWTATTLRFGYESLSSPATLYEQDLVTGERRTLKRTPTPNVDLDAYTSHREWATAPDGTEVPVDVLRRRDTPPGPCLVYGYGAYEVSMPPWFSVARLSLLDRGWSWALVHPRGGGELGRRWYENGKFLHKRNTFDDTNACAEHLLTTGLASSVALRGGSAGGLLVGACVNLRPDLWSAAVAEVPFVDVVTTMSDPSLPLTVTEWEEWGDPRTDEFAAYMQSYSPYDNVTPRAYAPMYVTAGLNDPRVAYHEPAKWVARIRAVRTDDEVLLLKTEMGAGHAGPSGRYERWRDEARVLTFLLCTATTTTATRTTSTASTASTASTVPRSQG